MDWMRVSSWARTARRLARNASARSSTSAIRRCSAKGGSGTWKVSSTEGPRRGKFAPTAREFAYSTIEGCRRKWKKYRRSIFGPGRIGRMSVLQIPLNSGHAIFARYGRSLP
jgi:hypothetical protein